MKYGWIAFVLLLALPACSSFQVIEVKGCQTFSGIPGPEDFDIDTLNGRRLIVSSQERRLLDAKGEMMYQGGIYSLVPTSGKIAQFKLIGRDDYPFHPHGISYIKKGNSGFLYVVNHALTDQHAIEKFRIADNELHFLQRFRSELLVHPNDLIATQNGLVYISNDRYFSGFLANLGDLIGLAWSNVLLLDTTTHTFSVAVDAVEFANGVEVDNEHLYVAALRDESIQIFSRDQNTGMVYQKIEEIDIGSGVDNLLWEKPGVLNVAAHPDLYAFLDHIKSEQNHSPSEIYRVILGAKGSHQVERIFADDGQLIDAASTGLVMNGKIFISGVFDPELIACPLN